VEAETNKQLAGFLPPIPSGTNAAHFHHAQEGAFGVYPAAAARLLTTLSPSLNGAGLAPFKEGARPWDTLILGKTLFGTLSRNAFVLDRRGLGRHEDCLGFGCCAVQW